MGCSSGASFAEGGARDLDDHCGGADDAASEAVVDPLSGASFYFSLRGEKWVVDWQAVDVATTSEVVGGGRCRA